jgi:Protein of unknown function (DUF2726)
MPSGSNCPEASVFMTVFEAEILVALCAFVALVLVIAALRPQSSKEGKGRYRTWKRSSDHRLAHDFTPMPPRSPGKPAIRELSDVGVQLNAIMKAAFHKRRVMNVSEYKVFKVVESEIAAAKKGHRVFAQTSLGQVLESANSDAFYSINAKRVDVLVVDRGGWPVFAVEYQGPGHYQGTAAARDAIKKEALRRAGVGYLEVTPDDSEEQLRLRIREQLAEKSSHPKTPAATPIRPFSAVPQLH